MLLRETDPMGVFQRNCSTLAGEGNRAAAVAAQTPFVNAKP